MMVTKKEEDEDLEENSDLSNKSVEQEQEKGSKKYSVISQQVREDFIKRVLSKEVTIKEAASEFGIKFSTSKAILQTYKREGRIGKKKTRQRKPKQKNLNFPSNSQQQQPQSILPLLKNNTNMIRKDSNNTFPSEKSYNSPQMDADIHNTMNEIKSVIHDKNMLDGYCTTIHGTNINTQSSPFSSAVGSGGQPTSIYSKLKQMQNSVVTKPLTINTGSNLLGLQNQANRKIANQNQNTDATQFFNPFANKNDFSSNFRDSPLDLKALKNQLHLIEVDQLKCKTQQKGEEVESDFNYNQYFQTQRIY